MSTPDAEPSVEAAPISTGYNEDGTMSAMVEIPPDTIAGMGYLTPQDEFGDVERGNPLPYTLPLERRREVRLERETWRLEVVADSASDTKLDRPLSIAAGTALDFEGLLKLGEQYGVQYLKAITCNNIGEPLGMGLWEGVPLKVVIWMAEPVENLRRIYYYGYHNDDPAQIFQSSLPIGRVLEEAPGELPVLLCYKLNGEYLTGKRGGPVRMVVPEAYGFKSVKWLQRIMLTNDYKANDTYALRNNDLESPMKSFARFAKTPATVKAGESIPIMGLAQVGLSGLEKVQIWLHPAGTPLPDDDPHFTRGEWQDAEILSWSEHWSKGSPADLSPGKPLLLFNGANTTPHEWPMRYTVVHWKALLHDVAPGHYELRCRSIDRNGIAQPMPRPFPKSGRAGIQMVKLFVEGQSVER